MIDLSHPLTGSLLAPFCVALVVAGALRRLPSLAPVGLAAGLVTGLVLTLGAGWWPPTSVVTKLVVVVVLGAVIAAMATFTAGATAGRRLTLGWLAGAAVWMAWPQLDSLGVVLATLVAIMLGAVVLRPTATEATLPGLAAGAVAIAVVAVSAGSLVLGQVAMAAGAAAAGVALATLGCWREAGVGLVASVCGRGPLLLLGLALVLVTGLRPWVALALVPVLVGDRIASRLPGGTARRGAIAWSIGVAAFAAAVALAAIFSFSMSEVGDDPYVR